MEIRKDFESVSMLLSRLPQYADAFDRNNVRDWSHLKNKEDFSKVYFLCWDDRKPLENIYATGRDVAVFMSSKLKEFNYADINPTLSGYVDSFENGWLDEIDKLKGCSENAKETCRNLDHAPWAILQMIELFDDQIKLLIATRHTIEALKQTDLYKWEKGQVQQSYPIPDYQKILELINSIGKMFERLPPTYSGKSEEELRDHILVSLQGIIIGGGSATGETFNRKGKTDLLIRKSDKNEFVGECKFWSGPAGLGQAIDQLLSYLSWRDTKAALIIFVKNKDFTSVIRSADEVVRAHSCFLEFRGNTDDSVYLYDFSVQGDQMQVISFSMMLYHIPPIS
ncbi:hypothetical protein [Larsenimonas rhizosphaerae]|uniref:hypothetical protein n=1 Tax=Larsenimonas rhizosphaerae TaxID=2944682 RepID=UPI002034A1CD|nr:hypothetical protein [Larsenimonas rhizosphaerae]MCM2131959.1 hypothetical protein [Larsenimonas rhizosphaerae]